MLGVLVIYVAWLHATLCPGAGVWCNHIAPLPGASCPGALINGFRGEPEEAAASGWSYLGPRCTWARHLHHCLACCNLACFVLSVLMVLVQTFRQPLAWLAHNVSQGRRVIRGS